jgi:hypothetical protein
MAQKSFPAHPRSRFANPIPRPHCSSQACLYNAPTLSLNVWISNNEEAPALHISAARRTNARLQDPTDRRVRSNSGGIGRRDAKTRPDNQLRTDCRLHAHRLPERARRDRRDGPVNAGHYLKSLAARPPKISALIVAIGSKVPPSRSTISRCRRCSAIRVERCPMETIVAFGRISISIR